MATRIGNLALLGCCLLVFGCSSLRDNTVPIEVAQAATYPPKPVDYKQEVKDALKLILKDPDSAQFDHWKLQKVYVGTKPPTYGWMSTVLVNAKNGFGGYTGYTLYHFSHEQGRAMHLAYLDDGKDVFLPHGFHIVEVVEESAK